MAYAYVDDDINWSAVDWRTLFKVEEDVSLQLNEGGGPYVLIPYQMRHPPTQFNFDSRAVHFRGLKRRIGVFFAGNVDHRYIDIESDYLREKGDRTILFSTVKKSAEAVLVSNESGYNRAIAEGGINKCIIIQSKDYRIPATEWFCALSKTNFFLCLPGAKMPLCHNAIEAMAVGTIPILNYPEWFEPKLEDRVNCLVYSHEGDIAEVINYALSLRESDIERLRLNAADYYDRFLHPRHVVSFLKNFSSPRCTLLFNSENNGYIARVHPHSWVVSAPACLSQSDLGRSVGKGLV